MRMCTSRGIYTVINVLGTHIVLEKDILPKGKGMILSNTSDGRLIFVLPYQGYTLVGTTDDMQGVQDYPIPEDKDVKFLKQELKRIFGEEYDFDSKHKASFAGLRPLCLENPVSQNEYVEKVKTLKSKDL